MSLMLNFLSHHNKWSFWEGLALFTDFRHWLWLGGLRCIWSVIMLMITLFPKRQRAGKDTNTANGIQGTQSIAQSVSPIKWINFCFFSSLCTLLSWALPDFTLYISCSLSFLEINTWPWAGDLPWFLDKWVLLKQPVSSSSNFGFYCPFCLSLLQTLYQVCLLAQQIFILGPNWKSSCPFQGYFESLEVSLGMPTWMSPDKYTHLPWSEWIKWELVLIWKSLSHFPAALCPC